MYPWVNRLEEPEPNLPPQNYDGNGLPLHGMVVNRKRKIKKDEKSHKIILTLE